TEPWERPPAPGPDGQALHCLRSGVNARLAAHAGARMVWEDGGRLALRLVPATLLGALWLQFAAAVDGGHDFRACRECGRWFRLDPATARTSREFCANAC